MSHTHGNQKRTTRIQGLALAFATMIRPQTSHLMSKIVGSGHMTSAQHSKFLLFTPLHCAGGVVDLRDDYISTRTETRGTKGRGSPKTSKTTRCPEPPKSSPSKRSGITHPEPPASVLPQAIAIFQTHPVYHCSPFTPMLEC